MNSNGADQPVPAVAVVGMGCWYPGASELRTFWENVLARRQQFRRFPDQRLPLSEYYDPAPRASDKTYATRGAFIDGFEFDWVARRIPRRTFESTDMVHFLALEVALAALEDAGLSLEKLPRERAAVLLGNSLTGEHSRSNYMRLRWPYVRRSLRAAAAKRGLPDAMVTDLEETMEVYFKSVFPPITEDSLAGGMSNTIAGRICNYLDFHGGGYTVDGACASGMIAVATAANALFHREIDFALAGGVDISLDVMELIGFAKVGALTRDDMNVYDRRGSGFIPGEGSGFLALRRLEDARAAGNYVYAVIRGWGISSDGKGGLTAPNRDAQALALRRAYDRAGYSMQDIAFVEGHGTATVVGDKTELEAVQMALASFGEPAPRSVGMTSFKSLIGHTKAASGVGGLIKAVMAVNQRIVPPTAGVKEPHSAFNTTSLALYPVQLGQMRDHAQPLRAGASAMGFGGINCHIAIESGDAPAERLRPALDERALMVSNQDTELFVLAAPSLPELADHARRLKALAVGISVAELTDLAAHWTQVSDTTSPVRAAVIARTAEELAERLDMVVRIVAGTPLALGKVAEEARREVLVANSVAARLGFLFPGQGSQQIQMARVLVERFPWARELVEAADGWLEEIGASPVSPLIYRPVDRAIDKAQLDEWNAALAQTQVSQPAICLASLIWLRYLTHLGIQPAAVAGHSLGELTAFCAAGAFDERTLLMLAAVRGRSMAAPSDSAGTMASLMCSREVAEGILNRVSGYAIIANLNSPTQMVISGEPGAIDAAATLAEAEGIQVYRLKVSNAFHSQLVAPAAEELRANAPVPDVLVETRVAVFSGVDAEQVPGGTPLREHFARQVMSQVDFVGLVGKLNSLCDFFLEVGPGKVLSGLVRAINGTDGTVCLPVASDPTGDRDLNLVLANLFVRGHQIAWDALYDRRLIRPFVPASERLFIDNPVERPFPEVEAEPTRALSSDGHDTRLAEAAGVSQEVLERYLEERRAFVGAVIRADIELLPGRADLAPAPREAQAAGALEPVAPTPESAASSHDAGRAVAPPPQSAARDVSGLLLDLLEAETGFPRPSLSLDMHLLDDLNLDSIKSAELIGQLAQQLGIETAQIDPAVFGNATLGEITAALQGLVPTVSVAVPAPPAASPTTVDVSGLLLDLLEAETGFPKESLTSEMRLLDDLNLDSIKSAELIGQLAQQLHVETEQIDPTVFGNATLGEIAAALQSLVPAAPVSAPIAPAIDVGGLLLDLLEAETGFPKESLAPDLRLLDDLNLDSIKSAELIGQAAQQLDIQTDQIDPAVFGNATLGEITVALQSLVPLPAAREDTPASAVAAQPAHAAATSFRKPSLAAEQPSWVRDFVIGYEPEDLPAAGTENWASARVLLLAEDDALGQTLERALAERGSSVQRATYTGLEAQPEPFTHLIALLPTTGTAGDDPGRLAEAVQRLHLFAILAGKSQAAVLVQFGGGFFGTRAPHLAIDQGAATAFAATVHHERPHLRVRVLDVTPDLDAAHLVEQISRELTLPRSFAVAGYDGALVRRVPRPQVQDRATYIPRAVTWTSDDVVVVTGGAKGITAECALAFARQSGARMALVGSSAPPAPGAQEGEIAQTLGRYTAEGLTARYYQCDVSNSEAVRALVAQVREELGPVTGVIHGAGTNRPRRADQVSAEAALAEVSPKVLGVANLCRALEDAPPKLIVGFSSLTAVTGMPGNAWYGFANEALDLTLRDFAQRHPDTQILSLAYSIWGEVGMGAKMGSAQHLAGMGIAAIPTADGVEHFLRLLDNAAAEPLVVVTARLGGLDTWSPQPVALPPARRYLEEIVSMQPGVEVIARARLSLDRDAYIRDHQYKGSYLFPTVFGLEAMAQTVAYATGTAALPPLRIEDVILARPISVTPDRDTVIEIRAEVLERAAPDAPRTVQVTIGTESTGFGREHYAARFVLGVPVEPATADIPLPAEPLPIDPGPDLYSWLLFQGEQFQRLCTIYTLDSRECRFAAESQTPEGDDLVNATGGPWLLGDPYFRDTLLQAGQLIVPQDLCLPVHIDVMAIGANAPGGRHVGQVVLDEHLEKQIVSHVTAIDDEGRVLERLEGYRAAILEHRPDHPTAEEIAHPDGRDQARLQDALKAWCREYGLPAPALSAAYLPGLHALSRQERHTRERPLYDDALQQALGDRAGAAQVDWLDSGKPVVTVPDGEVAISLAHDDRLCICVAGPAPQGVDVGLVSRRSEEEWQRLSSAAREPILRQLANAGDSLDRAGMRVWTAVEAIRKVTNTAEIELAVRSRSGDAVLFEGGARETRLQVLTFPITLTRPPERMVAVVVGTAPVPQASGSRPSAISSTVVPQQVDLTHRQGRLLELGMDPYAYLMYMGEARPDGMEPFVVRFPLAMRDAANLSRTIYFSHYFDWFGKLREMGMRGCYRELAQDLATGAWGAVTNWAETRIVGRLNGGDVVEGRVMGGKISPDGSRMRLACEWFLLNPDGTCEHMATSQMGTTWVAITGHGMVEPRPWPDYFVRAMSPMISREREDPTTMPVPPADFGPEIYRAPAGPIAGKPLLWEQHFETSLEEANLVGNIYYANYSVWQGRVRDHFFQQIAPEYFQGVGREGELTCEFTRTDHLREAMPFDTISVRLYLDTVYERGARLLFEYFRLNPDGEHVKLATGTHDVAWSKPTADGEWRQAPWPDVFREALIEGKHVKSAPAAAGAATAANKREEEAVAIARWRGYNPDVYFMGALPGGADGAEIMYLRTPVSMRDAANLSRTVYFSHYFDWLGKMREISLQLIDKQLAEDFATGQWGVVTNFADVRIAGTASTGDAIEGRLTVGRFYANGSQLQIAVEWWKLKADGTEEHIATSRMGATWVIVKGHGLIEPHPYPDYFVRVLEPMSGSRDVPTTRPLPPVDLGSAIYQSPIGPISQKPLLWEQEFETSLEESNLVGNVYFANYSVWMGRVRDHYFQHIAPEYFRGIGTDGELRCEYARTEHLREAMPFDAIAVRMYLDTVYERGARLLFEYFRLDPNGERVKLATGTHDVAWYKASTDGEWRQAPWPDVVREALIEGKQVKNAPVAASAAVMGHAGALPPTKGNDGAEGLNEYQRYYATTYSVALDYSSPHGGEALVLRFPVSFRESANVSRTLYFSHYYEWLGKVREISIQLISERVIQDFASGEWGWVTNYSETYIIRPAKQGDVIECYFLAGKPFGPGGSTVTFTFEWRKRRSDGGWEQVALSRMTTTWVKVRGHGMVEIAPFPDYVQEFVDRVAANVDDPLPPPDLTIDRGRLIYQAPGGPTSGKPLLREQAFETSLEEANSVGNLYYANYYVFMGRILDHYVHAAAPQYFRVGGEQGELRCTYCRVDHLREAMPFDTIVVRLYLEEVYERGVSLVLEYFRANPDGSRDKLAFGRHDAAWYAPTSSGDWHPSPLPPALRNALLKGVQAELGAP